ncbi:SEC-C domain-containing protein [bacterium]|nr:SEC-C domain-containing protein [bacterium]
MMSIIEKFSNISNFIGDLFEFVQTNEEISKDFDEYLKTLGANQLTQSALESLLLTYLFERRIENKSIFEIYEQTNEIADTELFQALKNTISGYFLINKIHKNGFELYNLLNEKKYDVVSLVKMTNFRGVYQGQYINSRIFEFQGTYYLLEISDVYSNSAKDNIYRYLVAKIIQEPESAYQGNKDKENRIVEHANKTFELFMSMFKNTEIVTSNSLADEVLNIMNDAFENNQEINCKIEDLIQPPAELKYFKVSDFSSDYNNFLENSLSGFSAHDQLYDVGIVAEEKLGLYVLPFWGTINKIFECNSLEQIEGGKDAIKYYLENDKIPLFVLEKLNKKFANFMDLVNKTLETEYTFSELVNAYKPMYLTQNIYSPTSVLYTSQVFLEVMGYLEQETTENNVAEEIYKNVGRNDLCPCGSGKKYKNCCLK